MAPRTNVVVDIRCVSVCVCVCMCECASRVTQDLKIQDSAILPNRKNVSLLYFCR